MTVSFRDPCFELFIPVTEMEDAPASARAIVNIP
jgi:hypothetical protein